jgi:hypothetical protein
MNIGRLIYAILVIYFISNFFAMISLANEERNKSYYSGIMPSKDRFLNINHIYETESGDILIPYTPDIAHNKKFSLFSIFRDKIILSNIDEKDLLYKINFFTTTSEKYDRGHLVPEGWPNPGGVLGTNKMVLSDGYFLKIIAPFPYNYCQPINNVKYEYIDYIGSVIYSYIIIMYHKYKSNSDASISCNKKNEYYKYEVVMPDLFVVSGGVIFIDQYSGGYLYIRGDYIDPSSYTDKSGLLMIKYDKVKDIISSNRQADFEHNLDKIITSGSNYGYNK